MSAVRTQPKIRKEKERREGEETFVKPPPDVPLILRITLWILGLAFMGMVVGFVWWSLDRPRLTPVPNLVNRSLVEAANELAIRDLHQGRTIRKLSETVPRDHVIDQEPAANTKVNVGSSVVLVVSLGSRYAQVPDLAGHTLDEARRMLGDVGLNLDNNTEEGPSATVEKGRIIGQFPDKKTKVDQNSRVRVKVSNGNPAGDQDAAVAAPDEPQDQEQPSTVYSLRLSLKDLTKPTKVRIDMNDDDGTSTIFEEMRQPGDVINLSKKGHGKQATFTVFYDDIEVLEQTKNAEDTK
jgi:hypothetical protein